MTKFSPPRFVMCGDHTEMCLDSDGTRYWRPAGLWGCGWRLDEAGSLLAVSDHANIDGNALREISEQEFRDNNRGYV